MNPKQRPTPPYLGPWNGIVVLVQESGEVSEMLWGMELEFVGNLTDAKFDDGWGVAPPPGY